MGDIILKVCEEYNVAPNVSKTELADILFEIAYGGDTDGQTKTENKAYNTAHKREVAVPHSFTPTL